MNITEETKSGLRLIASLPDDQFSALAGKSFDVLLRRCSEDELSCNSFSSLSVLICFVSPPKNSLHPPPFTIINKPYESSNHSKKLFMNKTNIIAGVLGGMDALTVKRGFAALVCLIVEGGKANSSSMQVRLSDYLLSVLLGLCEFPYSVLDSPSFFLFSFLFVLEIE